MSFSQKLLISLFLFSLFVIIVAGIMVNIRNKIHLRSNGVRTTGTFRFKDSPQGGQPIVILEYRADKGPVLAKYKWAKDIADGQEVEILYDPRRPDKHLRVTEMGFDVSWLILPGFLLLLAYLFYSLWWPEKILPVMTLENVRYLVLAYAVGVVGLLAYEKAYVGAALNAGFLLLIYVLLSVTMSKRKENQSALESTILKLGLQEVPVEEVSSLIPKTLLLKDYWHFSGTLRKLYRAPSGHLYLFLGVDAVVPASDHDYIVPFQSSAASIGRSSVSRRGGRVRTEGYVRTIAILQSEIEAPGPLIGSFSGSVLLLEEKNWFSVRPKIPKVFDQNDLAFYSTHPATPAESWFPLGNKLAGTQYWDKRPPFLELSGKSVLVYLGHPTGEMISELEKLSAKDFQINW